MPKDNNFGMRMSKDRSKSSVKSGQYELLILVVAMYTKDIWKRE
jgi:hypothetical protein